MPEVSFTKENLLERKQITFAWRKLKVKSVTEKPGTKDPDSTTWPTVFVVEDGPDVGVPINHWFTEKQMGRLAEYMKCFMTGDPVPGKKYLLEDTVGRQVIGYCGYDTESGFNVIKDFRSAQSGATA